ncbi:phage tail protein [Hymenobacter swuensis]|uniref:Phage tail collar domain-containing protein n=1 Tax=Hymenobacter swuensis DY53 TaxID=1227739 RepID=W8F4B5_9BACT|nr:tail fiber protein [Hymenobacter swuensis]AHJ96605.1 hypothetical protein Hsw_1010 [Hymenobacter swuensis DY53]
MDNYVGEIRVFAGSYAPENWVFCKGQLLSINDYDVLYSLIGTTYGGDGQTTFAVPNLQSRVVVGQGQAPGGSNYVMGMMAGQESVTLMNQQMAVHQHPVLSAAVTAINAGDTGQVGPAGAYFGNQAANSYGPGSDTKLNAGTVTGQSSVAGGNQPHTNIQPVLATNYIIALQGIYPSFD